MTRDGATYDDVDDEEQVRNAPGEGTVSESRKDWLADWDTWRECHVCAHLCKYQS